MILRYNASDIDYEDFKRELQKQNITSEEYQRAIIQGCKENNYWGDRKRNAGYTETNLRAHKKSVNEN